MFVPFVVQHEDSLELVNDFIFGISLELSKTCDCYIPIEYFAHERLICETKQTDKVVFQSRLVVTSDKNTAELLETLKQWVRTSPHLVVQGIQLNVDEYCSVELTELGDGECVSTTTAPPPETTATTTQNMNETEKSELLAHESVEVPCLCTRWLSWRSCTHYNFCYSVHILHSSEMHEKVSHNI